MLRKVAVRTARDLVPAALAACSAPDLIADGMIFSSMVARLGMVPVMYVVVVVVMMFLIFVEVGMMTLVVMMMMMICTFISGTQTSDPSQQPD